MFLQPFTSTPGKNWPLENYLAVAQHWHAQGWQIIFGGDPATAPAWNARWPAGLLPWAGVSLLVTGGLMQNSSFLVIGGDTGAFRIAVALGPVVVMLTDSGAVKSAHPFQHPDWVVTPPPGGKVPAINTLYC